MKALVTGGAGFIGSHLADALLAHGHEVAVADNLSTGRRENLCGALALGAVHHVADVCDGRAMRRIVARERPDVIFHLAAHVDGANSIAAPARDLSVNVEGTLNVLEAARLAGVGRVVVASTGGAIYGDADQVPTPEAAAAKPLSPYGQSKYAAEGYCRLYSDRHGVSSVCLRLANVYGPRQRTDGEGGVVAILCARQVDGGVATVFGDGLQTRDFTYVADVVDAALAAADSDLTGVANIGTGKETSVLGLIAELGIERSKIVRLAGRPAEIRRSCLDSSRAHQFLGWSARTSLKEGIALTVAAVDPQLPAAPEKVLILSAKVGEGHEAAARALQRDLDSAGVEVVKKDGLAAMGRLLQSTLEGGYRIQLRVAPWSYSAVYHAVAHFAPARALARRLLSVLGSRSLRKLIRAEAPSVIVSTHPAVTSVLGRLRIQGRITVPTMATVTDLADHPLWAHPGIDLHLVMAEQSITPIERVGGAGSALVVQPLVDARFRAPRTRLDARRSLGLDLDRPVIVVSGGGWGVGDVEGAARVALGIEGSTVICVAGRNDPLRSRLQAMFGGDSRVRVLGFTDEMSDLLTAADALVHSTGGMTFLEALTRGCPVIAYGESAGHLARNSHIMAALDLGRSAQTLPELDAALRRVLDGSVSAPVLDQAPGSADCVRTVRCRVRPRPRWSSAMRQVAMAVVCAAVFAGWLAGSDDAYALLATRLEAQPVTTVPTGRSAVALVIRVSPESAPSVAHALALRHQHATFAFAQVPRRSVLAKLRSTGDTAIPEVVSGGTIGWLETGSRLRRAANGLGLGGRPFYCLAPSQGLSLGDYLLAHRTGARPIRASASLDDQGLRGRIRQGSVVVLTLGGAASTDASELTVLESRLGDRGLTGKSLAASG